MILKFTRKRRLRRISKKSWKKKKRQNHERREVLCRWHLTSPSQKLPRAETVIHPSLELRKTDLRDDRIFKDK